MARRSIAEILLHPVRLRSVLSVAGRAKTSRAIQDDLDDIPQATLYRHINRLVEAEVLEVVDEQQVRGGVERTLALAEDAGSLAPADIEGMEPGALL